MREFHCGDILSIHKNFNLCQFFPLMTNTFYTLCGSSKRKLMKFFFYKFSVDGVARRQISSSTWIRCQEKNSNKNVNTTEDDENIPDKIINTPVKNIRNFSIIAHVDHGKSTLADRLLELTGAIKKSSGNAQILDNLQVEKERGITVKAQTVSLFFKYENDEFLLNLIDTPGHVDFSNEVHRSLAACDGVILLVDANHGVQAQTIANFYLAKARKLTILPILNKIDLKNANPDRVKHDLVSLLNINQEDVLKISAKLGTGIDNVIPKIISSIPPPNASRENPFRGFLFDGWFDRYRGAMNFIYVKDGEISVGDVITFHSTGKSYEIRSIYLMTPGEIAIPTLKAGQVGIICCNMRNSKEAIIGDTIFLKNNTSKIEPFPLFKPQKPKVYAGIYPIDQTQYGALRVAIEKLILNDSVVTLTNDHNSALGQGWRLGFLGLLHMEVFCQRLEQEYETKSIITAPSVAFQIKLRDKFAKTYGENFKYVSNPALLPEQQYIEEIYEPYIIATIICPDMYMGQILGLCVDRRGVQKSSVNIDNDRIRMTYLFPLAEIIIDFYDKLQSLSSGYASFDYEDYDYQLTNIAKLDVYLNGQLVEELSTIVHIQKLNNIARELVLKLKDTIPRQMVQIAIQACVGKKIIARETIKAYRKDVTAKLYGGDVTRRMKLLKQQSEGKKKMRSIANINVPRDTFINIIKR